MACLGLQAVPGAAALAELFWRSGRLILAFGLGHVGATLIVAVGLAAAIRFGWLPISVAHASDVGMSYGAVAVLRYAWPRPFGSTAGLLGHAHSKLARCSSMNPARSKIRPLTTSTQMGNAKVSHMLTSLAISNDTATR